MVSSLTPAQREALLAVAHESPLTLPAGTEDSDAGSQHRVEALDELFRAGLLRRLAPAGAPQRSYVLSGAGVAAARRLRLRAVAL